MNKILLIFIILVIFVCVGAFIFVRLYPNSPFIPYNPKGVTVQTETNKNSFGNPVRQLDQANDAIRRYAISDLEAVLKRYYSTNSKAPDNLNILVTDGYILEIETDPITKQPPTYTIGNQRGCKVELTLSDGSVVNGYCK